MTVVAEFEKPTKCEDCPCFYQTEGAYYDECQLTHKEIENYFIIDERCPLKAKENYTTVAKHHTKGRCLFEPSV